MAKEIAKEDGEARTDALLGEATQLKKRARRRLIGAAALALLAAVVLPMVMDHQPAPTLRDIQIRIPSPDEGAAQRVSPPPSAKASAKPEVKEEPKPDARPLSQPLPQPAPQAEAKAVEAKPEATQLPPAPAPTSPSEPRPLAGKDEAWEVQLGAYQNDTSVKNLVGKLKQLGIPTYTEKVETPNGSRTRVRAGPFPSQEAAEKARVRVKIVGVDGPVAKMP
jgi:DedD protein